MHIFIGKTNVYTVLFQKDDLSIPSVALLLKRCIVQIGSYFLKKIGNEDTVTEAQNEVFEKI